MTNNTIRANTGTYGTSDTAAIGPLMQGQAGVVMTFTLTDLGGTVVNLTGLTITGTITNNQTKATAALAGTIALVTPASGIFSWTTAAADVGTAGSFKIVFTVGSSLITLPAHLAIVETPAASTTFGTALVGVTVAQAAWLATALATLPDAADLANGPDPQGATDGHGWTADGADGAGWEAAAGGGASDVGDLTTTGLTATNMLRVAAAGGLEERTPAQVLSDIGAAASSSLASYLPKTAGSGEAVTGVLKMLGGGADVRAPSDTKGFTISVSDGGAGYISASGTVSLQFNNFSYIQFPSLVLYNTLADFSTHVNVGSGKTYKVNSVQVVGARVVDARCSGAINSGDATTDDVIDALRDAMIAHGLIAAA